MKIMLGVEPVSDGDDKVAFDADRPGRRCVRKFSGLDAIGPVGQRCQVSAVGREQPPHGSHHRGAARARLQSLRPGGNGRVEMAECLRNVARRVVADLVAIAAAIGLDDVEPLILGLEFDGDAIAVRAGARKLALVRNSQ